MIKLQTAKKILKPIKAYFYAPTNSGKTYGALLTANGIVQAIRNVSEEEAYKHIVLIDTEYGRGTLYASLGAYNYVQFNAPYDVNILKQYIIEINNMPDIDVIIIDSFTHFWSKTGGILDKKAEKDKTSQGNSYTNWQEFTTLFNKLVDELLDSPKHILITARAKSDTVLVENAQGKLAPKTFGLKAEMRDNFEFECDYVFNIDKETHNVLVEKGIGLESSYTPITPDFGKLLYKTQTDNAVTPVRNEDDVRRSIRTISYNNNLVQYIQLQLSGKKLDDLDLDALVKLETNLIKEVKKGQVKKH